MVFAIVPPHFHLRTTVRFRHNSHVASIQEEVVPWQPYKLTPLFPTGAIRYLKNPILQDYGELMEYWP